MSTPPLVGHLLVLPLHGGGEVMVDPSFVASVSPHRRNEGVTVVVTRDNPDNKYFVAVDYQTLRSWLVAATK